MSIVGTKFRMASRRCFTPSGVFFEVSLSPTSSTNDDSGWHSKNVSESSGLMMLRTSRICGTRFHVWIESPFPIWFRLRLSASSYDVASRTTDDGVGKRDDLRAPSLFRTSLSSRREPESLTPIGISTPTDLQPNSTTLALTSWNVSQRVNDA